MQGGGSGAQSRKEGLRDSLGSWVCAVTVVSGSGLASSLAVVECNNTPELSVSMRIMFLDCAACEWRMRP